MELNTDVKWTSVYMTEAVSLVVEPMWKLASQSHVRTWNLPMYIN